MQDFFRLVRYQNLLMIALVQLLIKYALFDTFKIDVALSDFQYYLLVLATLLIAAAGNVINDINDVAADRVNHPTKLIITKRITEKTAYNYYIILNVLGVGIGFYLANMIDKPGFSAFFIVFSALLYLYSTFIKTIVVLSNLLISLLVAMCILIVGLFDLFPVITEANRQAQSTVFSILLDYAFFAFLMTLLREIVKDTEDMKGDRNTGLQTLPIVLGRALTNKLLFLLGAIIISCVIYYLYTNMYRQQIAMLYFLLAVVAPLLFFCIKIISAKKNSDYKNLSLLLKLIMLMGMLSLLLYPLILI